MRIFAVAMVISALLTPASYAQMGTPEAPPLTDDEKAEIAKKKAEEKATDAAYKSTLKRLPEIHQRVDPWGGIRTPSASGGK
jgi:ribosomal protein L9